ncbi:hypothetical protein A9Q84_02115 [Halobacteriovorax marinus]|uniref:GP-PDE domain-containing protein n=1 Tax=Halobacteriovorax marinus TaxID=97084 RepID=A0A1Y5FGF0_9BACT|nr:hypothetical protein A9Q84_02115 [Halobacteriovorax marinus]
MKKIILITISFILSLSSLAAPFCVAHRAIGFGELENSLSAFEAAGRANAQGIEFDLLHSSDGKTLVYHDSILKRLTLGSTCPVGKKINDLTSREIGENCKLKNGEEIPSFENTLKVLSKYDSKIFIELKDTITNSDFQQIKKFYFDRPENVFIISFSQEALKKVISYRRTDEFFNQIRVIRLKKIVYFGKLGNYDGIDARYIRKSKVKKYQRQGKIVGVFTKNSKRKIKKYLRKGVDFITTNKYQRCENIIHSMN